MLQAFQQVQYWLFTDTVQQYNIIVHFVNRMVNVKWKYDSLNFRNVHF